MYNTLKCYNISEKKLQQVRIDILTLILEDINGYSKEEAKTAAQEYQGDFEDKLMDILRKI